MLGSALVVAAIAGVAIKYPGPNAPVSRSSGPGWSAPEQPKRVPLTARNRREGLTTAARFIQSAVARKDVGDSWDLIVPSMKAGYTRASWARGDIPVVPYPVGGARWQLDYSFRNRMGLKVALFPKRGADVRATVFTLDLRAVGKGAKRRWLVESFMPAPVAGLGGRSEAPTTALGLPNLGERRGESRLGSGWLLFPLGLLSLVLLVPLALGVAHWYRGARANRAYARERARSL